MPQFDDELFLRSDSGAEALNTISPQARTLVVRAIYVAAIGTLGYVGYSIHLGNVQGLIFNSLAVVVILLFTSLALSKGNVTLAFKVFVWGAWVQAILTSLQVAGIKTPTLVCIPGLIMVTAWTQGRRTSIAIGSASGIALIGLVVAEKMQWISVSAVRAPEQVMVTYLTITFIAGAIAIVLAENFKRVLNEGRRLALKLRDRVKELDSSEKALRRLNEELEERVFQRTHELEDLVTKLGHTQRELVKVEKLASLGAMVAGISHELNTPIGNSLTVASTLQDNFKAFTKAANAGLKKSELQKFLADGSMAADLVVRSNLKAAELIASFKKVAVDQTSEKRRIFDLREVVDDNLAAIGPTLRKHGVAVSVNIITGIECDSFPGPLGQILDNLVSNAVLHAFEERNNRQITVAVTVVNSDVHMEVSDNGIGMSPQLLSHIFDPFFTTKMGRGGSGLGLSVSHRIATSILGGTLSATSKVGLGSSFHVIFPKTAAFSMSAA